MSFFINTFFLSVAFCVKVRHLLPSSKVKPPFYQHSYLQIEDILSSFLFNVDKSPEEDKLKLRVVLGQKFHYSRASSSIARKVAMQEDQEKLQKLAGLLEKTIERVNTLELQSKQKQITKQLIKEIKPLRDEVAKSINKIKLWSWVAKGLGISAIVLFTLSIVLLKKEPSIGYVFLSVSGIVLGGSGIVFAFISGEYLDALFKQSVEERIGNFINKMKEKK